MLVSSANMMVNVVSDKVVKSFMKIWKSKGPITEPCGTPHVIFLRTDFVPLNFTSCSLPLK